jgi:hypothetical protein
MAFSIPHEFMTSQRGRTASKQPNSSRNHHQHHQQTSKSCKTAEEQLVDGNSTANEQIEISKSGNSSSNNASCDQLNRCHSTFSKPVNNVVDSNNCEQLSLSVGYTESKTLKLDIGNAQREPSNSNVGNKERGHCDLSVCIKEKGHPKSSIINTRGQHLKETINDSVSPDGHVTRAVSPAGRRGKVSQLQLENEEWNRFLRNISCDAASTQEA